MSLILPVTLPINFSEEKQTVKLPIKLPMYFGYHEEGTVKLPVKLPMYFGSSNEGVIKLPLTLPFKFKASSSEKVSRLLQYNEHVNLQEYHGTSSIPYSEVAIGKSEKIPYKEKAWFFPGLILSENIISKQSVQLTVAENIQSLILVDFELLSTNTVKLKWYGNTTPGVIVMKKTYSDESYVADATYAWNAGEAVVDITNEDYCIYLQGTANSGSSAVYTIGGTDVKLVQPQLDVILNNKIYVETIDYTSVYKIEINY